MKKDLLSLRLFLFGIVVSSLLLSPYVLDFTLVPRFTFLALVMLICVYLLSKQPDEPVIKPDLIVGSYVAYCLFCFSSVFWALNKAEAMFDISKTILGLLTFLFTVFFMKRQESHFKKTLLKIAIGVAYVILATGIWQLLQLPGLQKDALYSVIGLSGHKNLFASFLFLDLFFLLFASRELGTVWKVLAVCAIVLSLAMIALLRTKAVWLGITVSTCAYLTIYLFRNLKERMNRRPVNFFSVLVPELVLSLLFFIYVLPPAIEKGSRQAVAISAHKPRALMSLEQERLVIWSKTYQLYRTHPVTGLGAGNWQVYFPDATLSGLYRAEDLNFTFQRPHNDFLWILSETGIIGLGLFLLFLLSMVLGLTRALRVVKEDAGMSTQLRLCLACIAGYFTIAFFDFPKERIEHSIWINLLFGIAYYYTIAQVHIPGFGKITVGRPLRRLTFAILCIILLDGIMRYKGEYYVRRLYDDKNSAQGDALLHDGKAAWSAFYTLDPTSVPVRWYIANANVTLGNYTEAQKYFMLACRENPYNRNVLNDLASAYVFNKDTLRAISYYCEASRISPRFDDPKLNLAAIYIRQKKYKAADSCLQTILHDSPRRSSYQKIVDLFK